MVYYNEIDPFAVEWLAALIEDGLIAEGDIDNRSITDVTPNDIKGYRQHHFFAGIGVWSYALRQAGWPDDRSAWTGSCPCQPFSAAGQGKGTADERHLWPAWFHLIRECRPRVVFGEQVEAAIRHGWLDLVQSDLEGEGYAVGKAVLSSRYAGFDDERPRLYFVADTGGAGRERPIAHHGLLGGAQAPLSEHDNGSPRGRSALESRVRRLLPRNGTSVSVERSALRCYGNAINAEVAQAFIRAYCEVSG